MSQACKNCQKAEACQSIGLPHENLVRLMIRKSIANEEMFVSMVSGELKSLNISANELWKKLETICPFCPYCQSN